MNVSPPSIVAVTTVAWPGILKVESDYDAIVAEASLPIATIKRAVVQRTINLIGGGVQTPEFLDDSLTAGMAVPFVRRSAPGDEPGKPIWDDLTPFLTPPGGDYYHHVQSLADTTWTIDHMLGRNPAVTVLDSAGTEVECAVFHVSVNQVVLTLSYAVSGTAECS